jgi:hypothetical protein
MDVEMGKGHIGCLVGELDSLVVRDTMKPRDYITIEPAAIIARMLKRKAGVWLKISGATFYLRLVGLCENPFFGLLYCHHNKKREGCQNDQTSPNRLQKNRVILEKKQSP